MSTPKFDLQSENFDLYFAKEISKLNEHQRGDIPRELFFKLFRRGGVLNYKTSNKIGFLGKLFLLAKGAGKNVFIVIEDENGASVGEFAKLKKDIKSRGIMQEHAQALSALGTYVAGGKELIDTLAFMSKVNTSPLYNYLTKLRNVPRNKVAERKDEMTYITRFLCAYEGNKKKWIADTGLNIQEFMILLAMYHGDEVRSLDVRNMLSGGIHAGSTKMKTAFSSLQTRSFIVRYGRTKTAKMQITPLGSELISRIILKTISS